MSRNSNKSEIETYMEDLKVNQCKSYFLKMIYSSRFFLLFKFSTHSYYYLINILNV